MTTLAVIAKAPMPGAVKTRLCPPCTPAEAARLAEASLSDTLSAVRASPAQRRVIVLDGQPGEWLGDGIEVIGQRGDGLAARLAAAFEDLGGNTLIVGMDTPQVTPRLLTEGLNLLENHQAVLGGARDGGYWAIGLQRPDRRALDGIPMSSSHTGRAQLDRLQELGLSVAGLEMLDDFDDIASARVVAGAAPGTAFARAFAAWEENGLAGMNAPPAAVYARGLERPSPAFRLRLATGEVRPVPFARWLAEVDESDELALTRVTGPVLDVGCGPGRHVQALARRGMPTLGIDASPAAVRLARSRGLAVFHGSIFDDLPQAGHWASALLLDGNLGIGGRPERLLRRIKTLLRSGGTIVAEVDPPGTPTGTVKARLEGPDLVSRWFRWATVGADGIGALVHGCGMRVVESFSGGGRWFVVVES